VEIDVKKIAFGAPICKEFCQPQLEDRLLAPITFPLPIFSHFAGWRAVNPLRIATVSPRHPITADRGN